MQDAQLIELSGRHFLISKLLDDGLEVAIPVRDRGVDLIAYLDLTKETKQFVACPIQLKASQQARFGLQQKYARIANVLMVYVWHLEDEDKTCVHALSYGEAYGLLKKHGHTETDSWKQMGGYTIPNPNEQWLTELREYEMTPGKWRDKISAVGRRVGDSEGT